MLKEKLKKTWDLLKEGERLCIWIMKIWLCIWIMGKALYLYNGKASQFPHEWHWETSCCNTLTTYNNENKRI